MQGNEVVPGIYGEDTLSFTPLEYNLHNVQFAIDAMPYYISNSLYDYNKTRYIDILERFLSEHEVRIANWITGTCRLRYLQRRSRQLLWFRYRWHRVRNGPWVGELGHVNTLRGEKK